MVAAPAPAAPAPLIPALGAMTGLQALIALALFAPGVLAPKLGIDATQLGVYSIAVFATGTVTSLWGGVLAARLGSFRTGSLCAVAVAAAMGLAALSSNVAVLVLAGVALGLAFGPETPASSALLGRLVSERDRPFIFSVRQTGNQLGAMAGSLVLPLVALSAAPQAGYVLIIAVAGVALLVFEYLRPRYDILSCAADGKAGVGAMLALLRDSAGLRLLAVVSIPCSAMQLALNLFFVTFAIETLGASHVLAGTMLATAQASGLVGRLGWGAVAARGLAPRIVIAGLAIGMGVIAVALAAAGPALPVTALFVVAALFGLTASGWNGVFLAEVARLAPPGRIGEATGAILMASYSGLVAGPIVVSAIGSVAGLAASYAAVGLLCAGAGLALLGKRRAP
jgi:MFS family permease